MFPLLRPEEEGLSVRVVERQPREEPCNAASHSKLDPDDGRGFISTAVLVAAGACRAGALLPSSRFTMVHGWLRVVQPCEVGSSVLE